MFLETTAYRKLLKLQKRIRAVQGGTAASKTISIIVNLIAMAQTDKKPTITSIVSESFPHLRKGAIRDFLNIMQAHKYFRPDQWNKTDYTYDFETGSKIEFFSADQPGKVRGPRRDRLFINEANNIPFETFEQLEVRTKEFIFLDWNPTNEFWFYTDVLGKRNDVDHITLTYKDNEALGKSIIESIEQRRGRPGWWKVYGLGELGEVEGKIYKDWEILDELPKFARLERYGLDFGYSNDPTAIVAVYYSNGGYVLDEICFLKGLSNKQIADTILNQEKPALVIADSAEPKSIDEIKSYGINIVGSEKGKDSVCNGIQLVQDQKIAVTSRSINLIKEYRNYLWETDKDGKILNVPEHAFSHCFAPETLIYTTEGERRIDQLVGQEGHLYTRNGGIERFSNVRPTRRNAEVVSLTFDDGKTLTVTPDHELLLPSGEWKEAGLLCPSDLIQSVTYDCKSKRKSATISWRNLYEICFKPLLQGLHQWATSISAQGSVGVLQWGNTSQVPRSPQERGQSQQPHRQPRASALCNTSSEPYDTRTPSVGFRAHKDNLSPDERVARIGGGDRVAQKTREKDNGAEETQRKGVCSLPQKVLDKRLFGFSSILPPELQNESPTKKIERITRGRRPITYDLEVENTHCLLADGVIAHNSMDASRYAISSILKKPKVKMEASEPLKPYFPELGM